MSGSTNNNVKSQITDILDLIDDMQILLDQNITPSVIQQYTLEECIPLISIWINWILEICVPFLQTSRRVLAIKLLHFGFSIIQ